MPHAEIVGAGFAGLAAATALARMGWTVRVHEKAREIRSEGFAFSLPANAARVLTTLDVLPEINAAGMPILRRETRTGKGKLLNAFDGFWSCRVNRTAIVSALARAATGQGVEIAFNSHGVSATADGTLIVNGGRHLSADLVLAADGAFSSVRDNANLKVSRSPSGQWGLRTLVPCGPSDSLWIEGGGITVEYWSGSRRVITSPCSPTEVYLAFTAQNSDLEARRMPIDPDEWSKPFPVLATLLRRAAECGNWDRVKWVEFETIRLPSWSRGRLAFVGDAAHAMTPNLGQGAACALMNGLSLATYVSRSSDLAEALAAWERLERPMTEHAQSWSSSYGKIGILPDFLRHWMMWLLATIPAAKRSYRLLANHVPTGTR